MAENAFGKDLGYLVRFFDKIEAHADSLGANEAARLKTLMGEERARWDEITQLLSGAPATAPSAEDTKEVPHSGRMPKEGARPRAMVCQPAPPGAGSLTVGSLIPLD